MHESHFSYCETPNIFKDAFLFGCQAGQSKGEKKKSIYTSSDLLNHMIYFCSSDDVRNAALLWRTLPITKNMAAGSSAKCTSNNSVTIRVNIKI